MELGQQASITIPVTPHLLRHTYASELANRGVDLKVIQALMGHAKIRTTSHYAHVDLMLCDQPASAWQKKGIELVDFALCTRGRLS